MSSFLRPEDYIEPACPLCMDDPGAEAPVHSIPIDRVRQKLDAYLSRNDYAGAERHLAYWLSESEAGRDRRGAFFVHNERMGLYRKLGRGDEAIKEAETALALVSSLGLERTVSAATCELNAATVYKAFAQPQKALGLFERARAIYEDALSPDDARLGGLYNNMALALCDLKRYEEAEALYQKALDTMARVENGAPEMAVSCLNLANALEARLGLLEGAEQIEAQLERAKELLEGVQVRDGNYAFVCEKCAATFGYYGHFWYQQELEARAKAIYEQGSV